MPTRIAVTGASGFVGKALIEAARERGISIVALSRVAPESPGIEWCAIGDLAGQNPWGDLPPGIESLVHLAAAVHMPGGTKPDSYYQAVNSRATAKLARLAARAGVRRFVFLSTAKVLGDDSGEGSFTTSDPPNPQDAYSRSKWSAEQSLRAGTAERPPELVVVRPPLVYGPGVRANFAAILRAARLGLPLPVGALLARRSLLHVDNLVDFLLLACTNEGAKDRTWLVSDGRDLSVADLYRTLCREFGHDPWLAPVSPRLIELAGFLTGQAAVVKRLTRPLRLDVTETRRWLGWNPPRDPGSALSATCDWFLGQRK